MLNLISILFNYNKFIYSYEEAIRMSNETPAATTAADPANNTQTNIQIINANNNSAGAQTNVNLTATIMTTTDENSTTVTNSSPSPDTTNVQRPS